MPKIQIAYNEELTKEKVKDIFTSHFSSKYEILDSPMIIGVDFAIKKSSFTGITIKYKQNSKKGEAYIIFNAYVPSAAARILLNGLLLLIILMTTSWPKMTKEVKEFIQTSQDLKAILKN
jgi:hypothetical protein